MPPAAAVLGPLPPAVQRVLQQDRGTSDAPANALPVAVLDARAVSSAIAWLTGDDARRVPGVPLPVDAGFTTEI